MTYDGLVRLLVHKIIYEDRSVIYENLDLSVFPLCESLHTKDNIEYYDCLRQILDDNLDALCDTLTKDKSEGFYEIFFKMTGRYLGPDHHGEYESDMDWSDLHVSDVSSEYIDMMFHDSDPNGLILDEDDE